MNGLNNLACFACDASFQQSGELKFAILRLERYAAHSDAFGNAMKTEFVVFDKYIGDVASGKQSLANIYGGLPPPQITELPLRPLLQPNNTRALFSESYRVIIKEAPYTYDKADKEPTLRINW